MERAQATSMRVMDVLFHTGYPAPINLFVAVMLILLPVLTPLAGTAEGVLRASVNYGTAGLISVIYLLVWSRLRIHNPSPSTRFVQLYLIVQTALVSLIYVLDGGLTRFLFVTIAVQAVYVSPVRRWAPFLGTLGTLWLTLYIVISPNDAGASRVAIIGMYLCYLIFAAVVTFTTVQQERQVRVAQELLGAVDERHQSLRNYDLTAEPLAEVQERERLAQTIYATLHSRLAGLLQHLADLRLDSTALDRRKARGARLLAKGVLSEIRHAVRTLRPEEDGGMDDDQEDAIDEGRVESEGAFLALDPIRVYHVWNLGVIVITTGVMLASDLVGGTARWLWILLLGLGVLAAYGGAALIREPRVRTLLVVVQAGLSLWLTWISQEPLMNHLLMIVAAQIVFLVPMLSRWVTAAVIFPTVLSGAVLWSTEVYLNNWRLLISLSLAFAVTYFFAAVMAFMTRRQVEARQQAMHLAAQMDQVNRLLEAKLEEVRRMVVARERIRMAREIHDSWGHHMTMAIVELQYAEELAGEDRNLALQHIGGALTVVEAALHAGREMVQALERFERPIPETLSELVLVWRKGNKANVALQVTGDFSALPTTMRVTLYRVVQESLTNIQKHARAQNIEIQLVRQRDRVLLTVVNDHTGGAHSAETGSGGFGLLGLRERATALQGEFTATARRDGGFEVKLVLPLGA